MYGNAFARFEQSVGSGENVVVAGSVEATAQSRVGGCSRCGDGGWYRNTLKSAVELTLQVVQELDIGEPLDTIVGEGEFKGDIGRTGRSGRRAVGDRLRQTDHGGRRGQTTTKGKAEAVGGAEARTRWGPDVLDLDHDFGEGSDQLEDTLSLRLSFVAGGVHDHQIVRPSEDRLGFINDVNGSQSHRRIEIEGGPGFDPGAAYVEVGIGDRCRVSVRIENGIGNGLIDH